MMKLICAVLSMLLVSVVVANKTGNCKDRKVFSTNYWMKEYNMFVSPAGFIKGLIHSAKTIIPNVPVGDIEVQNRDDHVHTYSHKLFLVKSNATLAFTQVSYLSVYHVYHTDEVILHVIDPSDNSYTRIELGKKSGRYYAIVPAYAWETTEFLSDDSDSLVFYGLTHFRQNATESKMSIATREEMLQKFPQLQNIVNKVYDKIELNKGKP